MTENLIDPKSFYLLTTVDSDIKELYPGLVTGQVFYQPKKNTYEFAIFVDPRRRGYTFTDKHGIVPILRLDLELAEELLAEQEDPARVVLHIAFKQIQIDLECIKRDGVEDYA